MRLHVSVTYVGSTELAVVMGTQLYALSFDFEYSKQKDLVLILKQLTAPLNLSLINSEKLIIGIVSAIGLVEVGDELYAELENELFNIKVGQDNRNKVIDGFETYEYTLELAHPSVNIPWRVGGGGSPDKIISQALGMLMKSTPLANHPDWAAIRLQICEFVNHAAACEGPEHSKLFDLPNDFKFDAIMVRVEFPTTETKH